MALRTAPTDEFAESTAFEGDCTYVKLRYFPFRWKDGQKWRLFTSITIQPDEEDSKPITFQQSAGFLNSHIPCDENGDVCCPGDLSEEDAIEYYRSLAKGDEVVDSEKIEEYMGTRAGLIDEKALASKNPEAGRLPAKMEWSEHVTCLKELMGKKKISFQATGSLTDYEGLHVHLTSLPAKNQMELREGEDPNKAKVWKILLPTDIYPAEKGAAAATSRKPPAAKATTAAASKPAGSSGASSSANAALAPIEAAIVALINKEGGSVTANVDRLGGLLIKTLDKKQHANMLKALNDKDWMGAETRPWAAEKLDVIGLDGTKKKRTVLKLKATAATEDEDADEAPDEEDD